MSARILIFSIFMFSSISFARGPIARVMKVKGKVTQLRPGAIHPSRLKLNDVLYEDASVATSRNSFVKIQYIDHTVVNLGPDGMIRLEELKRGRPGVLNLLKGKIRASIRKDKPLRNKFFVKTRTAAMGVRGTEFQTTYNPESKNTSTLTFKGEVAMAKLNEAEERQQVLKKFRKYKISQSSGNSRAGVVDVDVEVEEEISPVELGPRDSLAHVLSGKKAASVKNGQFSGTYKSLKKVSDPVKINPVQLTTLYQNSDMAEKKGRKKIKKADATKVNQAGLLAQAEQTAPPEGYYDASSGSYAPKAGGFLDVNTGIYIPPAKDAEFDAKRGIFTAPKVGNIDQETGQYVPPKGLKLDAKEGFIVTSKRNKKKLLAMRDELNTDIMQEVLLDDMATESQIEFRPISQKEGFVKDHISVDFYLLSQELEYSDDVINGAKKVESSGGYGTNLIWDLASGTKWQPFIGLGSKNIEMKNATGLGFSQGAKTYYTMMAGIRYFIYPRFNVLVKAVIEQNPFLEYKTAGNEVNRMTVTKFLGVVEALAWERERLSLHGEAGLQFNPSKNKGTFNIETGYGFQLSAKLRYFLGHKYFLQLAPGFAIEKYNVSSTSLKASATRTQFQTALTLGGMF